MIKAIGDAPMRRKRVGLLMRRMRDMLYTRFMIPAQVARMVGAVFIPTRSLQEKSGCFVLHRLAENLQVVASASFATKL